MIQVENLWKKFHRHEALRGLSFNVPAGSAYALIGANGAGKTTTIKTIMNILEPTKGRVTTLGVDSRRLSPTELSAIGYVSENQEMPEGLTGSQYLDYLRAFYPDWDKDLEQSIRRDLSLVFNRKIRDLSHGMRIKLALACALPYRPKLLVLDEPFSGLDPLVREEFMSELLSQPGETTVFISTHELGEIEGVATHVGFIDEGRLLFEDSMENLTTRFREVRVTLDHEAAAPPQIPKGWLHLRPSGSVLTFVDSAFSETTLAEQVRAQLTGVRHIETERMSLRSIFTTLARAARNGAL
jgi:ABC-2 type transport system ATP-binding protein